MPRISFAGGGLRFQEGTILVQESVATIFQYPAREGAAQSAAFPAMVWKCVRCDSNQEPIEFDDVEIIHRMGEYGKCIPAKLREKDFDNMDAEPEECERDETGNTFILKPDVRPHIGWAIFADSLSKAGFKQEIAGRGITTDYEGGIYHITTQAGRPYIAKQGDKAGQEVTPTNLVCDRIYKFPYEGKKPSPKAVVSMAKAATKPATKANGASDEVAEIVKKVLSKAVTEARFKKAVPAGKEVPKSAFWRAIGNELMYQKISQSDGLHKKVTDYIKDDEQLSKIFDELQLTVAVTDEAVMFGE